MGHFDVEDLTPATRAVGVAFHGGRPVVLTSREGNGVYVHDIVTHTAVGDVLLGHTGFVLNAALVRTRGTTLVTSIGADNSAHVWDLESGESLGDPLTGLAYNGTLPYCPAPAVGRVDGRLVAVSAFSREVRVWDLTTMSPLGEPLCGGGNSLVSAEIITAGADAPVVVTGDLDGTVRFHDLADGRQIRPHITASRLFVDVAAARVGGRIHLVRSDWQETDIWSLGTRPRLLGRAGTSRRACLGAVDGRAFAVSSARDHTLHAWELSTQAPLGPPMTGHTSDVMALRAGDADGVPLVASASMDGTVRLWDVRTGHPVGKPLDGHGMGALCVDFARLDDMPVVVSGAGDGRLRFWRLYDRSPMDGVELERFPSPVRAVRVADIDGEPVLVAADSFGLMRVWDMRSPAWTAELDVGSGITGLSIGGGQVCVATQMGAVALGVNGVARPVEPRSEREGDVP